ncbi:exported protein of unknown function [Candidatus Hydrogenisulfobacillus filiaventi]|uniref:Cell wall-binding repeat-containing protein n=1 Tax=Candidatus Hydrogenisulfobacillus filiaventi TaxID=2707344 RepID=A0A6F8ZI71_9FIRM|nr:exported protein of unknown function [Candidatus Hydrogenisulfobacillus filiaventi]
MRNERMWRRMRKRMLAASGLGALVVTTAACGAAPAPQTQAARPAAVTTASLTQTATRLAGSTRAGTALAIAKEQYPTGASTVILASGADQNLFDPLVAGPLAYALKAPILLTNTATALNPTTATGLQELGAKTVILVGADNNATLQHVLTSQGYTVTGYGSSDQYATATAVAQALLKATGQSSFSTVFITSGNPANVVDALSGGSPAAMMKAPILLAPSAVNGQTALPASEAALAAQATTAYQLGAMAFATVTNLPTGANVVDLGEQDRFGTSWAVNFHFFPSPTEVFVANGAQAHIVDALAATPYAAAMEAPVLLVNDGAVPTHANRYLSTLAPGTFSVVTFGGSASIPSGVGHKMQGMGGGTVFATLDGLNRQYIHQRDALVHQALPEIPASGPYADRVTVSLLNNPTIMQQYGGPAVPASPQAVGVSLPASMPSDGAIIGLTPTVISRLAQQMDALPRVAGTPPLSNAQIVAAVRTAARYLIDGDSNQARPGSALVNPQGLQAGSIRPHVVDTPQDAAAWLVDGAPATLPSRNYVYRVWADVSDVSASASPSFAQSPEPSGHIGMYVTLSGLQVDLLESGLDGTKMTIGLYPYHNIQVALDLVQSGSQWRWYVDANVPEANGQATYAGSGTPAGRAIPTQVFWTAN